VTRTSGGYAGQYYWWGEDIGYTYGLMANSKAAYTAGRFGRVGFQERAVFIDTVSYLLEVNSPDFAHLQQLLRPAGGPDTGTPQFNAIGMDIQFYEGPYETRDGLGEATISTHRLGLSRHGAAGGFLSGVVYTDVNENGAFDAGEGPGPHSGSPARLRSPKRSTAWPRKGCRRTGWRTGRTWSALRPPMEPLSARGRW
jgi:hypothetical protein